MVPISMKGFEHIPSFVYIFKLHILLCVCIYTHIHVCYKTYKGRNERGENSLFLYATLEAIALGNGEERNNFKLVELLSCLCFRVTTQAVI